nr:eri1 exoribonuclease 3 [Hymenolepis microstoma]
MSYRCNSFETGSHYLYAVPSLEDISVRWIVKNFYSVVTKCSDCTESKYIWRFPYPDCRIVARPAEKILLKLCKRQVFKEEFLNLFSIKYVDLVSPVLRDVVVSPQYLRILRDFKLYNLTAASLKETNLNSLISCLGENTTENLVSLNLTNMAIEENKLPVIISLGRLKNLQVLNVSRTKFTSECLQNLVKLLPRLRFLNISRTNINNISALLELKTTLTGLIMHKLNLDSPQLLSRALSTILELSELRVLDVSSAGDRDRPRCPSVDRLCEPDCLPHLTHFDICGNQFSLKLVDVKNFIKNHPNLEFVGLAAWPSRQYHELQGIYQLSLDYPHIAMTGDRGEKLLLATLIRNKDRRIYLQNAFHNIFEETASRDWLNPDLLAAVLRVMRLHMNKQDMILAGTAVVYNLTRGEQSAQLPLDLLNRAVSTTLTSIEHHQEQVQLLKNCFLTLCSDNVLHRAKFSCKRCCELVFKILIRFNDIHIKRMGVAIISILAAEILTSDLKEISSDSRRLQRLLIYVVEKCLLQCDVEALMSENDNRMLSYLHQADVSLEGSPIYDTTLRFTLSALWNLTDECPEACQTFVNVGGLVIYAKVLKKMASEEEDFKNHVYTKCLGLLNNVAEVPSTKQTLLMEPLMAFFNKMLSHSSIQISYFAAGIVSHLACLPDDVWISANQYNKADFIRVLGEAVCKWTPPQNEMVAYRSFQPFQSLILDPNSRLEIHLWAVWAIHHILTKKNSRYVPILRECLSLQRFLLYVVSTDVATLCASPAPMQSPRQNFPINSVAAGDSECDVLHCGPVIVPESWRKLCPSYYNFFRASIQKQESPVYYSHQSATLPFVAPSDSVARLPAFDEGQSMGQSPMSGSPILTNIIPSPMEETISLGPTESQLTCAHLLQRLAVEIIEAVLVFEAENRITGAAVSATT